MSRSIPAGHDFIGGDEPQWGDIQHGLYAELDWIYQAASECRKLGQASPASSALIYVGRRLTGRTTGFSLLRRSFEVFPGEHFFIEGRAGRISRRFLIMRQMADLWLYFLIPLLTLPMMSVN